MCHLKLSQEWPPHFFLLLSLLQVSDCTEQHVACGVTLSLNCVPLCCVFVCGWFKSVTIICCYRTFAGVSCHLISLVKEVSLPLLCSHLGGEIESCRDVISSGHLTAALSSLLELSCRACSQMFWYFFDFCNSFYIKIKVQAIHLCLHTAQVFIMLVPDPCRLLPNSLTCNQADFTEIFCTEISCP